MRSTIDADPDRNGKGWLALTLDQNTGDLGVPDEQVVWPLQFEQRSDLRGAACDPVMQCERGHK
jgi:hypothetical protein